MALAVLGMPSRVARPARRAVRAHAVQRVGDACRGGRSRAPAAGRRPRRPSRTARRASAAMTPPGRRRPVGWRLAAGPRAERVRHPRAARSSIPAACAATASTFVGPPTPRGFSWLIRFDSVRRNAAVILNGRRIGRNVDPYTPFTVPARGLRPGRRNVLEVIVDGRKDPQLPEAWWNWNGIVRPVHLDAGRTGAHRGPRHDVARALQGAGAALQGRPAARRHARAPRRPGDQAVARRAAARTRRPRDRADVPAAAPRRGEAAAACSCRCRCRRRCCGRPTHPSSTAPCSRSGTAARCVQRERRADRAALGPGEGRATSS